MTPDDARQLVAQRGGSGSLDDMLRALVEAPTLLALLGEGMPLGEAQRVARERAAEVGERFLRGPGE